MPFFPVFVRDPWLSVRGGVPCGGAAGSAQGSDGEPGTSTQPGTRGVKPAATFSQHRGGLQFVGPEPGRTATEAGGEKIETSCIHMPCSCRRLAKENSRKINSKYCNEKLNWWNILCSFTDMGKTFWSLLQILSHSRSRDGTWLSPDNLRQILSGLEARPTGLCWCGLCVSVHFRPFWMIPSFPKEKLWTTIKLSYRHIRKCLKKWGKMHTLILLFIFNSCFNFILIWYMCETNLLKYVVSAFLKITYHKLSTVD